MGNLTRSRLSTAGALLALLLLIGILALMDRCSSSGASDTSGEGELSGIPFVEREVPVFREALTEETLRLRFYEDMPNVAYVGISSYYGCVARDTDETAPTLSITKQEGGVFELSHGGVSCTVDVDADVMVSRDMASFTNLMGRMQRGMGNAAYDGMPYVRVASVEATGQGKVTFDLSRYGIDIRAGEDDVYFPVATLSDIFSDLKGAASAFNGATFYCGGAYQDGTYLSRDPAFAEPIRASLGEGLMRPPDVAAFTYAELCFAVDRLYGFPGSGFLNDLVASEGLDAALRKGGEWGTITYDLLRSEDFAAYLVGLERLDLLLSDGGTTTFVTAEAPFAEDEGLRARMDEIRTQGDAAFAEVRVAYDGRVQPLAANLAGLRALRLASYGAQTYVREGNVAVCVLDSFGIGNRAAWRSFYEGSSPQPTGDDGGGQDGLATLLSALARAERDLAVDTLVIDVSANRGGSIDALVAAYGLLTGEREVRVNLANALTGQVLTETFLVDRNFDGSFDERDGEPTYDLPVVVQTSAGTYGLGTLFASMMAEAGCALIGEDSGAAGCLPGQLCFADGLPYKLSSFRGRMADAEGTPLLSGVAVAYDLLPRTDEGVAMTIEVDAAPLGTGLGLVSCADYRPFFDLPQLAEVARTAVAEAKVT